VQLHGNAAECWISLGRASSTHRQRIECVRQHLRVLTPLQCAQQRLDVDRVGLPPPLATVDRDGSRIHDVALDAGVTTRAVPGFTRPLSSKDSEVARIKEILMRF
jgi:hypothetical protein